MEATHHSPTGPDDRPRATADRARPARRRPRGLTALLAGAVSAVLVLSPALTSAPAVAEGEPASPTASPTATPTPAPSATSTPTTTPTAVPGPSVPAPTGKVVGRVVDARGAGVPRARVALFDLDWNYLRDTTARRTGRFALSGLATGRYRLQVTDSRAAWRTDLFAPRDARVSVHDQRTTVLAITVRRGAFLTGQVTRGPGDRPASRALVRATDPSGRHHEVRADKHGRFALGGLAKGTYRVWADDASHRWVGPTTVVRGLTRNTPRDLRLQLPTRAGGLNGFVLEGGRIARHTTWVTVVHRRTGQWRVVRVRNGDLALPGLAPGRHDFTLTGTRTHAGRSVTSGTKVRAGRTGHVTLRLGRALG